MPSSSQLVQVAGFGGLAEAAKATQEDQARQQLLTAGCLAELATRFKHLVCPIAGIGCVAVSVRVVSTHWCCRSAVHKKMRLTQSFWTLLVC